MSAHAKFSGTWRTLEGISAKFSGTWRTVTNGYVKVGGSWEEFFTNLTVSASSVSGSDQDFASSGFVSTAGDSTDTTPVGGTSPFTYAWTKLTDAEGPSFAISNASAQNPQWSGTRQSSYSDNTETWRVTVTDDNGNTATDDISVTLIWTDLS